MTAQANKTLRQQWMQVLARAGDALMSFETELTRSAYRKIRAPETGMVMVRGRSGGTGQAFNVGEMTVTRCVVRLDDGSTGYSYIAGRNKQHAELAALADAHLQGNEQAHWMANLIQPLQQQQQQQRSQREADVAASKVSFFTMVRGD